MNIAKTIINSNFALKKNWQFHAMNTSITQATQNDKQISKSINVLTIDDSMFERNRFKKVELLAYLISIYNKNKKRCGKSRYLLSVIVDVVKDNETIQAKVVYVRNRNNRKEYLCLISADVNLEEDEIIRVYGKRWDTEVFFKVCKSYLNLSKECKYRPFKACKDFSIIQLSNY